MILNQIKNNYSYPPYKKKIKMLLMPLWYL